MHPNLFKNDTPNKTYSYTESKYVQKRELKPWAGSIKGFLSLPVLWDTLYI